jgi:NADH:ubiquinone oxidoreductase subunit 2 (subunit N)
VVVGALATALSLYYYLAVIRALYMRPAVVPSADAVATIANDSLPAHGAVTGAIALCLIVTVGSFFAVGHLVDLATKAATAIF